MAPCRGQQGSLPSGKSLPSSTGTAPSIWQSCFIPDSQKGEQWMFPPRREKSSHLPCVSGRGETTLCCLSRHIKYTISLLFLNSRHNPRPYNMFRSLFQTIKASASNPNTPIFPSVPQAHKSNTCLDDFPHQWMTCSTDWGQDALVRDVVLPENASFFLIPGNRHHFLCLFVLQDAVASPPDRALPPEPCAGAGRNVSTDNPLPAQPHWDHSTMDKSALMSSIWASATQAEVLVVPVMSQGQSSDAGRRNQGCSCPSCICSWNEPTIPLP